MFKIIDGWKDSMIWCPSQCHFKFIYSDRRFEIYLRWRWNDPWTLELFEYEEDWVTFVDDKYGHRFKDIPFLKQEDDLNYIKKVAFIAMMKWLKQHKNG